MPPLPTDTRDASLQGSVWHSLVKLGPSDQLACEPEQRVEGDRECLDLSTDEDDQYCNDRFTHAGFVASAMH